MTVKLSKCLYPFFNVNFYIEIRLEKFVEILCCDPRWEFSTTISPIMRGLKTLISLPSLAKTIISLQTFPASWHAMVIPNADNNSCLVNVRFLNFYSMVIIFFCIFITPLLGIFHFYSQTRPSVPVANGLINSLMANCFRSLVPWFIHEINNAIFKSSLDSIIECWLD